MLEVDFEHGNTTVFRHLCKIDPTLKSAASNVTDNVRIVLTSVFDRLLKDWNPLFMGLADIT